MKVSKILAIVLACLLLVFGGLAIAFTVVSGLNQAHIDQLQADIKEQYSPTAKEYVYCDSSSFPNHCPDRVDAVLSKLPSSLAQEIKNNWIFVFSADVPEHIQAGISAPRNTLRTLRGVTDPNAKTVWLFSDNEKSLAHEIGHVIANEISGADNSDNFCQLYNSHKNSYVMHGQSNVDKYYTSSSVEFWAMLCEEYLCYPQHLQETFYQGYHYADTLFATFNQ